MRLRVGNSKQTQKESSREQGAEEKARQRKQSKAKINRKYEHCALFSVPYYCP